MSNKDYYAPGTYNDARAPWNEPDYSDDIADYQWETYVDRLTDEPDIWIAEGITQQAGDKAKQLYLSVQENLKLEEPDEVADMLLGARIRELVQLYATPSEDEALDAITQEPDDYE